jgi:hypothetical protein
MSDWTATHSASIGRGLDQEMPSSRYMNNQSISALLSSGAIDEVPALCSPTHGYSQ